MISVAVTLGWTIEAPADAAYAVLPVGVDSIIPVNATKNGSQLSKTTQIDA